MDNGIFNIITAVNTTASTELKRFFHAWWVLRLRDLPLPSILFSSLSFLYHL